jgi:signal transduction histidine kinase
LSENDQEALMSSAREESYAAGSVICREGDPGDALFIVRQGRVAVLKEVGNGDHTLLGYRGTGEILGEVSLVGQQPRTASLIAADDTELICVAAEDFPGLMDQHPGIGQAILKVLSDRLQAADLARTSIFHEERAFEQRLERASGEAARLAELARVRQETIEIIAHDLRTPLTVIDGCLQMLRSNLSEEGQPQAIDMLDLAERSSSKLMALLEELLSAARREVPTVMLIREPVDVAGLLSVAVESARVSAKDAKIKIGLEVAPGLPSPVGDRAQLDRVTSNLLDNALSYTPTGGRILVGASANHNEIRVSITDTGPGVPREHRELIFERFSRVPGSKGRKLGFGLGLHFCRQVIEAHRGQIWVEAGPEDVGSRFIYTLPLERDMISDGSS